MENVLKFLACRGEYSIRPLRVLKPVALKPAEPDRERQEHYQERTRIVIPRIKIPQFQPGATVPVRIDPKDRNRISLDIYSI